MKKTCFLFLLILSVVGIKAQNYRKIDSLKKILNSLPALDGTEADTLRMKISSDIGLLFLNNKPDSAKYWYVSVIDSIVSNTKIKQTPRRYYYNAQIIHQLALVYKNQGNYSLAIKNYENSIKIKEILGDKKGLSISLMNLGIIYYNKGDYPKSLAYYEKALIIAEEINYKRLFAACFINMGIVYDEQGNYPKAIEYYEKSLKRFEELKENNGISTCILNLGISYEYMGDYKKAIDYYEKALKIFEELEDKYSIATGYINIGNGFYRIKDYNKALEYYDKALNIKMELRDKRGISKIYNNTGSVYDINGDYIKAEEFFIKSIKIKEELGLQLDLADNYPNLASVYVKQQRHKVAASLFLQAVRMKRKIIQDNFTMMSEKEKGDFLNITGKIFNSLNEFGLLTQSDSILKQCYDNELMLKGLLLNSSSSILMDVVNSKDTALTNTYLKYKQLKTKIAELQSTPLEKRKLNVDSIEKIANEVEGKLAILSKDFANLQKQYTYKWLDVQSKLQADDIAIEFIRINYQFNRSIGDETDSLGYAALIIKKGFKSPQIVNLCGEVALQKMVGDLSWSDPSLLKLIYQKDSKKGLRLYNYIWKPLEQYLVGVKNIYYAPVGVLNQISFVAIPTPDHNLLSDVYKLNLLSSTRVLIDKEENKKIKFEDAVIYGGIRYESDSLFIKSLAQHTNKNETQLRGEFNTSDSGKIDIKNWYYLEGTATEGKKIEDILIKKKIKTTYYNGYQAMEDCFKENKTSPSILHIATHGFSFPTPVEGMEYTLFENSFVHNLNPLFRSGLLFAGANRTWSGAKPIEGVEDGVLTAYEVSNLNLSNTKLVVLSACETGLGEQKGNEGVYGLQRSFKMAGAKYIVMSLWQVPDAQTVELMELFYKELFNGNTMREAFGKAQDKMKLKYEPYYWAGFVLLE